jgi:hypothetical protein
MQWTDEYTIGLLAPYLEGFKKADKDLYRFRCPICGDSKKDRTKTRGYLYTVDNRTKVRFHCHNCNTDLSFYKFLEKCFPQFIAGYRLEKFRDKSKTKPATKASAPPPKQKTVVDLSFLRFKSLSTAISELPAGHPCRDYVMGRQLPEAALGRLYWCDDISKYGIEKFQDMHEGRLVVPAFHVDGSLQGMTCRDITGTAKTKYYAGKVDPDDDTPMVFGIERMDSTKTVFVVEGPLDSFFFENGIAVGGSAFKKVSHTLPKDTAIIIGDNQPRNKAVVATYKWFQEDGWTMFVWPKNCPYKDVNEIVQKGYVSHEKLLQFVKINSFSGLRLKIEIGEWIKNG